MSIDDKYLLNAACNASSNAYAPYSDFRVGACVLYEDGSIYQGCNVENASYGLTICAERNAISNAVSCGQKGKIIAIAIFSPNSKLCYPCGACLQWIVEFSSNCRVIVESDNGEIFSINISDLLPYSFKL